MQLAQTNVLSTGKPLRAAIWAAQVVGAVVYVGGGLTKLFTPIAELSHMMAWTGDLPEAAVRAIGAIDVAGGLGLLLPSLTRITPRLTVAAAVGCTALQICATVFHLSRGEAAALPFNLVLIAISLFVLWGRGKKAPIAVRGRVPS